MGRQQSRVVLETLLYLSEACDKASGDSESTDDLPKSYNLGPRGAITTQPWL